MSSGKFERCKICKKWDFLDDHKCLPKFEINYPEDMNDEWQEYYGHNHKDVAIEYARIYNEDGDYSLMDEEIVVNVRKVGEDKIVKVAISAEPDIYYSSSIVEDNDSSSK